MPRPIRIMHVLSSFNAGGAEINTLRLAEALADRGFSQTIAGLSSAPVAARSFSSRVTLIRPESLRDCNEKLFTAQFPQCMPPTLVTRDAQLIKQFLEEQGEIILKPLDGMGGSSIFHVKPADMNTNVIIESLTEHGTQFIMIQKYIPEISEGDKRILVIDGEPLDYALARIPSAGETRGNLAAGGTGKGCLGKQSRG